jgi:hypothetical protein
MLKISPPLTPEEIETLNISRVCPECEHRMIFHGNDYVGYCNVEGCHCEI